MNQIPAATAIGPIQTNCLSRNAVPLICFLVAMIDGYDTQMLSFLAPLISKEWGMAAGSFGKIFASTYGGGAVGATLIGIAADRFGRKTMLLFSLASAGICVFLSAWSGGPTELMAWRAVSGLGLGGAIPTISALTAQHAPLDRRRRPWRACSSDIPSAQWWAARSPPR
jgi:AAHS family 4-hydroxybenzoate transporter-like MFS transporter